MVDRRQDATDERIKGLDGRLEALAFELRQNYIMRRDIQQMLDVVEERYKPVVRIVYFIASSAAFGLVAWLEHVVTK